LEQVTIEDSFRLTTRLNQGLVWAKLYETQIRAAQTRRKLTLMEQQLEKRTWRKAFIRKIYLMYVTFKHRHQPHDICVCGRHYHNGVSVCFHPNAISWKQYFINDDMAEYDEL
jgi:hypothetical protein